MMIAMYNIERNLMPRISRTLYFNHKKILPIGYMLDKKTLKNIVSYIEVLYYTETSINKVSFLSPDSHNSANNNEINVLYFIYSMSLFLQRIHKTVVYHENDVCSL